MPKIFDLGHTPEEWPAKLRPRGVELSPRTLRSKARLMDSTLQSVAPSSSPPTR